MHPIIVLLSHPRSMSTAMERVMRKLGDLTCFHEPFVYDYYIVRQKRVMPHFEAETDRSMTYEDVRNMLLREAEKSPVFVKDMSYYVMPHLLEDEELSTHLTNTFLIRDPIASIPSYFKLDPDVTSEEIGLEAQANHLAALLKSGQHSIVIQAEDIRADSIGLICAFWKAISLPPADHAFEWQDEKPEDWKQVDGRHGKVSASKGMLPITDKQLQAQQDRFNAMAESHPVLNELLDHHLPHYEILKSHALSI